MEPKDEDLVTLNEMMKESGGRPTTYQRMKRKLPLRALEQSPEISEQEPTLLKQGCEPERIVAVTSLDSLDLLLGYLVRYKTGQLELVPNRVAHRCFPQLVIDFLESRLIFDDQQKLQVDDFRQQGETENEESIRNQDSPEDIYVLDELSRFLDVDYFRTLALDNEIAEPDSVGDHSSQIQKLADISEIVVSPDRDRNIVQIDSDDLPEPDPQPDLNCTPGIEEIVETLSMSRANQDSPELSSMSLGTLDELVRPRRDRSPDLLDDLS